MDYIKAETINMKNIQPKKGKSFIIIGDSNKGGIDIKIEDIKEESS